MLTTMKITSMHENHGPRNRLAWDIWGQRISGDSQLGDVTFTVWTNDPTAASTAELAMKSETPVEVNWCKTGAGHLLLSIEEVSRATERTL